jgi:hypothetical protein
MIVQAAWRKRHNGREPAKMLDLLAFDWART